MHCWAIRVRGHGQASYNPKLQQSLDNGIFLEHKQLFAATLDCAHQVTNVQ